MKLIMKQKNIIINNNWDDLEKFNNRDYRKSLPTIKINNNKTIYFSAGFIKHAKKQISLANYVELSYSKTKHAIVFNFLIDKKNNVSNMKIFNRSNNTQAVIAGLSFLNYFNIQNIGKYIAQYEEISTFGKLWVIYL